MNPDRKQVAVYGRNADKRLMKKLGDDMKIYEHKFMDFVLKDDRIDFIWKADTADMKTYDLAVAWLSN